MTYIFDELRCRAQRAQGGDELSRKEGRETMQRSGKKEIKVFIVRVPIGILKYKWPTRGGNQDPHHCVLLQN